MRPYQSDRSNGLLHANWFRWKSNSRHHITSVNYGISHDGCWRNASDSRSTSTYRNLFWRHNYVGCLGNSNDCFYGESHVRFSIFYKKHFQVNIHHTGVHGYPVPPFLQIFAFRYLSKILFVRIEPYHSIAHHVRYMYQVRNNLLAIFNK